MTTTARTQNRRPEKYVGRRYHHANQPATIAGDPFPLRARTSGARFIRSAKDQAI